MFSHIQIGLTSTHGQMLRSALLQLEGGYQGVVNILGAITTMLDGDGSDPAHFTEMTVRFGFASNAISKAAYEELQSLASKLTTDAQVSSVNAALTQAWNKFR